MNENELLDLVRSLREVIGPAMGRSLALRRAAALIGRLLIEEAEANGGLIVKDELNRIEHQYDRKGEPTEWDGGVANEATPAAPALAEAPRAAAGGAGGTRGIVPLKIGDAVVPLSVAGTTEEIGRARAAASSADEAERESPWTAPDLELIETRCRLKARSCELFVARNAAAGDPERMRAVHESISSVLREAKATRDCFLWVLWREREQPTDRAVSRIGRCYLALAEAAALMRRVDAAGERAGDEAVASAMQLLAEADSALRVALSETWLTVPDRDQDETHLWLKHETAWRRVFLERYMTISDPGDPARADDVIREASAISERVAKRIASSKSVDSALTKLRYHVNKAEADAEEYHFERIIASLEALAALGVSARDRRVVEALPPAVIDAMPERLREHAAVQGVLSARRKPTPGEETVKERAWSARVQEARGLVEGRSLVMVGGEPRNEAIERLKRAFGLSRVEWVHLSEHGSSEGLRGPISRPETAAVLVLIKLTGHLHAEEAQRYARSAGKPWIYLTAGYNPEQVAEALLQQAGERLREVANERVVS